MYYLCIYIYYYILNTIKSYFQTKNPIFRIKSIISYPDKEEVSVSFMGTKLWNPSSSTKFYKFKYFYGTREYFMLIPSEKINDIFPYKWNDMRSRSNKIISAKLYHINETEYIDLTNIIKQYAGPKENFYSDVGLNPKLSDILEIENVDNGVLYIEYITQTKMFKADQQLK